MSTRLLAVTFDAREPHALARFWALVLGEIACDGSRDVGLFWSAALRWPLVWDEHQETATQSPHGGTKIAWGGPPVATRRGRNRQRLDLLAADGDPARTVDRLVALGATRLAVAEDGVVELADPDGNEFSVLAGRPDA